MSDFDEGYRAGKQLYGGEPNTNEGWAGYRLGRTERERNEMAGWSGGGNAGLDGAAAGAIGPAVAMLAILYFVVVGAIAAAISALLGGWVVMLWAHAFDRRFRLSYGDAYQAAFASLFVYLAVTFVMSMLLSSPGDRAGAEGLRIGMGLIDLRFAASLAARPGKLVATLPVLLFLHGPGLLAAAVVLGRLVGGPLGGIVRFPRALLALFSVVVGGIAGTYSLAIFLLIRADDAKLFNPGVALPTFIGIGAAIVALAVVGGPIGAALLLPVTRRISRAPIGNWANAYVTTALALLAFGVASAASAFLFQGSDAFTDLLYHLARNRHRDVFYAMHRDEMFAAVPGLLMTQLPALMAAATVFAMRIRGVYLGAIGFLKAVLVATVVAIPPYLIVGTSLFLLVMA
jgi:hypothetical protein